MGSIKIMFPLFLSKSQRNGIFFIQKLPAIYQKGVILVKKRLPLSYNF